MIRIIFLLLIALLTGCRPATETETTLVWATNHHPSRIDAIKWFEKQNPGIRVRLMPISDPRQFFLRCIYGEPPDVITFFSPDTFQAYARNGLLKVLQKGSAEPWPFYEALKSYSFENKSRTLMALPQVAYPYVLYFNPDLVPAKKAMAVESWDDLLDLIIEQRPFVPPGEKKVFGLDIHNDMIWLLTWYWQRGGRFFSPEGHPATDQGRLRDTLAAMTHWRKIPGILPRPSDRMNLPSKGASQGVLGSLFLQGRAMFYWSGSWKISDFYNQTKVPWQVRCLPKGPENSLSVLGGNAFGVAARSRHPEAAQRLVAYLAGKTAQQRHMAHHIYLPARPDIQVPQTLDVLRSQAANARCMPSASTINGAMLKEIFKQALERHRLGMADPETIAAFLARALASGSLESARE